MFKKFLKDERGAEMTEYILIIALIAIAVIGAVRIFGDQIKAAFGRMSDKLGGGNRITARFACPVSV